MFFLAWREIRYAKMRYSLIGFIIFLISLLIFMVSGLAKGLSMDNASLILKTKANYFYVEEDMNQSISRSSMPLSIVDSLEKGTYSPVRLRMGTAIDEEEKKHDITFIGTEGPIIELVQEEGKAFGDLKEKEAIASIDLKNEGFKVGDRVKVSEEGETVTIAGFTDAQSYSHTPIIFLPFSQWENVMGKNPMGKEGINTVFFDLKENEVKTIKEKIEGVELITKDEVLKGLPSYSEEQLSLNMMITFLYVIGAFVLAVFFYVMTLQKRSQFGVLKAIGSTTAFLGINIVSQVLIVTLFSLGIAWGATIGITKILPKDLPFYLPTITILQSSGILLFVSVLGASISLLSVIKVDAIEAIGKVD